MFLFANAILLAAVCATLLSFVLAEFASCQPGWGWANNSVNQNPCEVAGALEASCQGFSVYILGPLSQGTNYVAPQKNASSNICECNTVMYSLYMACTACQNVTIESWTFWDKYCTEVYVTQYPNTIPSGTAIPHWAYLDVTANSNKSFNAVLAEAAGDTPEGLPVTPSVVSVPSSSTSSPSIITGPSTIGSSSTSSGSGVPGSSSSTNPQSTSSSSTNAGAIAGGVVGGLAVLGVIGGLIAWYSLRRRRQGSGISGAGYPENPHPQFSPDTNMSQAPMRFYDPSDPSTFPPGSSVIPPSHSTTNTTDLLVSGPVPGRYTGVPEL